MMTLTEARYQAVINYLAEFYPDFDSYAAQVPFVDRLLERLDQAEINWWLRREEANEQSRD